MVKHLLLTLLLIIAVCFGVFYISEGYEVSSSPDISMADGTIVHTMRYGEMDEWLAKHGDIAVKQVVPIDNGPYGTVSVVKVIYQPARPTTNGN